MRRFGGLAVALVALVACDDGGGAADRGAPLSLDGGADQGGGSGDPLQDFCDQSARARCAWAFGCLQPGAIRGTFGLNSASADACTADLAASCLAEVRAREARGTLDFQAGAVESCVRRTEQAPCLPGDPGGWVRDWYQYLGRACNSVARGNVPAGGECEVRADCLDPDLLCAGGRCRRAEAADIMQACGDTVRSQGTLSPDPGCAGELCLGLGANAEGLFGTCTADCRFGTGCPSGGYCLQLQAPGSTPSWFCTWPCARDADCAAGLSCTPVNASEPDAKHCYVTDP